MKTKSIVVTVLLAAGVAGAIYGVDYFKKTRASGDAAVELSKTIFPKEQHGQMIETIVRMGLSMQGANTAQAKDGAKKDDAAVEKDLRDTFSYDYFIDLHAKAMAKNFSKSELVDLQRFFATEAGKKWMKTTPAVIQDTMMQVRTDFSSKMNKIMGIEEEGKGEAKAGEKAGEKADEKAGDKKPEAKPTSETAQAGKPPVAAPKKMEKSKK